MKWIDLDIALVPQEERDANELIALSVNQYLNSKDRIPHLTLSMLRIDSKQVPLIHSWVADNLTAATVHFKDVITTKKASDGDSLYWLECERTSTLLSMHALAMDVRQQFHQPHSSTESLTHGCLQWMNHFEQCAGEHFSPHFTLGKGGEPSKNKPPRSMKLIPEVLIVYDNCFCRRW